MTYHFMTHTKRMEEAGIFAVRVTLGGVDAAGNRLMVVTPHESVRVVDAAKFPARTFCIDGTDKVLEQLIDDMVFGEGGPTPEKLQAAIDKHPLGRADLLQWYADWILDPPGDEEAGEDVQVDEATVTRTMQFVKGLMRGHAAHRKNEARAFNGFISPCATCPTPGRCVNTENCGE